MKQKKSRRARVLAFGLAIAGLTGTYISAGPTAANADPLTYWIASGCVGAVADTSNPSAYNYFAMSELSYLPGHECRVVITDEDSGIQVADVSMRGKPTVVFLPDAGTYHFEFRDVTWENLFEGTFTLPEAAAPDTDAFTTGTNCRIGDSRRNLMIPGNNGDKPLDTTWTFLQPSPTCDYNPGADLSVATRALVAVQSDTPATLTATVSSQPHPDAVDYSIEVSNPSLIPYAFSVNEAGGAVPITCPDAVIAPGATITCPGHYAFTPADDQARSVKHQFTVAGVDVGIPGRVGETGQSATASTAPVVTAITPPPALTGQAVRATVGATYEYQYAVTGGGNVTLKAGTLPPGLTLTPGGKLVGTPSAAGTFAFTLITSNSRGSQDLNQSIVVAAAAVNPPTPTPTPTPTPGAIASPDASPAPVGSIDAGGNDTLAATGTDPTRPLLITGALLAAGLALLILARRVRTARRP